MLQGGVVPAHEGPAGADAGDPARAPRQERERDLRALVRPCRPQIIMSRFTINNVFYEQRIADACQTRADNTCVMRAKTGSMKSRDITHQ
eukprot:328372-Prorocentrum_minimum.AAC.1